MVTWSDLLEWRRGPLDELYAAAQHDEQVAQEQSEALYAAETALASKGHTADGARATVADFRSAADRLEGMLTDFMSATLSAAQAVGNIAQRVSACQQYAETNDLLIDGNGTVTLGPEILARAEAERSSAFLFKPRLEDTAAYKRGVAARDHLQPQINALFTEAAETDAALAAAMAAVTSSSVTTSASMSANANGTNIPNPVEMWGDDTSPADVRAQWDALSEEQQAALIAKYPEFIGQLNGVPFEQRVEANDLNIETAVTQVDADIAQLQSKMESPDLTAAERDELQAALDKKQLHRTYFLSLLNGDGALLFDPSADRLIEVVGDINQADIADVLTYVSPTGANFDNFSTGDIQNVSKDMVERGEIHGNPTVAFVYKDGPWVTWFFDERGNANADYLQRKGDELAEFQDALMLEGFAQNADINAAGHSAGHTVLTASQSTGAHYDEVFSLAGSFMPEGWTPQIGTKYNHMTYGFDMIDSLGYYDEFAEKHPGVMKNASGLTNLLSEMGSALDGKIDPESDFFLDKMGQGLVTNSDKLNVASQSFGDGGDLMASTPKVNEFYEKHSFTATYRDDDLYQYEVKKPWMQFFLGEKVHVPPIDSHWRVSTGADRNAPLLETMFKKILEN